MRVWKTFSRCSAGRIRARVACPSRSAASKVDRNRTGAGVSAAGRLERDRAGQLATGQPVHVRPREGTIVPPVSAAVKSARRKPASRDHSPT